MIVRAAARTHVGNVRKNNEDAYAIDRLIRGDEIDRNDVCERNIESDAFLACVADGMGGLPAGEIASRIALESLVHSKPTDESSLRKAVTVAGEHLHAAMVADPSTRGMGTTLAGIILTDAGVLAFGIGDCFVAQVGSRALRPLLRSYGEVGASASVDSALGGWPQSFPITIETHHLTESAGTFFLATDGVPAGTSLDDLRTIVLDANQSLDERIDALTKHILSGTAPDNFTCALIGLQ